MDQEEAQLLVDSLTRGSTEDENNGTLDLRRMLRQAAAASQSGEPVTAMVRETGGDSVVAHFRKLLEVASQHQLMTFSIQEVTSGEFDVTFSGISSDGARVLALLEG